MRWIAENMFDITFFQWSLIASLLLLVGVIAQVANGLSYNKYVIALAKLREIESIEVSTNSALHLFLTGSVLDGFDDFANNRASEFMTGLGMHSLTAPDTAVTRTDEVNFPVSKDSFLKMPERDRIDYIARYKKCKWYSEKLSESKKQQILILRNSWRKKSL